MIELGPLEERLALFAEGIAGRYFHIKASSEFSGRRATLSAQGSTATSDTLYLPERLDAPDPAGYRVLALQQLSHLEFGTYTFAMATAVQRLPGLTHRDVASLGERASDFEQFHHQFEHPALVSRLFQLCERVRVDALMARHYPGIRPHLQRLQSYRLGLEPALPVIDLAGAVRALERQALGAPPGLVRDLDATGCLAPAVAVLERLHRDPGDVYDAAAGAIAIFDALASLVLRVDAASPSLVLDGEVEDPANWVQREARLEDWREELAALDASLTVEALAGDGAEVADADGLESGQLRPDGVDLRRRQDQRDRLARRVDMERSAIRDALGQSQSGARSYRYDEWNYLERRYLPRWCRLFEARLAPDREQDLAGLQAVIRTHRAAVQKPLEQIKPLGYQRVSRVADGDELDFAAVVEARQDARAAVSPDERVYSRRERVHRDVCAAFLVDLSASTDDPVEPPAPPAPEPTDEYPNLRDPYLDPRDDALPLTAAAADPQPRRIIDVQREAMLVMSAALEQLGDGYGIYGFSGYGRDCVEFFVAKEPDERFSRNVLAAIAGMQPKRSTRMGPAIRHAVRKLVASGNALKVLLIISDGFPQDCDYGPQRGDHEYGLQDTARALREAQEKGVETFCVTVDRSGNDYLKRMCPDARYLVIDEVEDLPQQLSKIYQTLTS